MDPARGLSAEEAARRLAADGPNRVGGEDRVATWSILAGQFRGAMLQLLLAACVLSAILGEVVDAVAIAAIVLLNALVGFLQEHRAERALLALRSLTAPHARVRRDGRVGEIPAAEVVAGDLLLLDAGDLVAADARLVEAHALATNEAPLTGESIPVGKRIEPVAEGTPLAERTDTVFMGTAVAAGTGLAEVTATGSRTELGRIARLVETAEETATPLQRRLEQVGRQLLWSCLGVVAVVAAASLARGASWLDVLLSSVSLAVAAVPEGLAAIVTIALAIGVRRMARRHVLVRRLGAVETLGCTTVICTDKTGTLTTGTMRVRELWGDDDAATLRAAAGCSDAELDEAGRGTGDPTEIALLVAGREHGIERSDVEREDPRTAVTPFDSDRKRMSVLRASGTLLVKGAPEVILARCSRARDGAAAAAGDMARRGLRVLAVARGEGPAEERLTLLGFVGLADPPRPEAAQAVADARAAGVRTVMITGDHPETALAIARELGVLGDGDDPADVVHARVTAEDKLTIVRDWKRRGAVVAMTGDGVNDAPALREAHAGIAMGKTGTEVTREASDMVLTDDNFASIVAAVKEGRGTYENIRKALVWMLGGNAAEILIMLGGAVAGLPLPLLPLQLLWINLVTDGLPALALVMDPAPRDALRRPPRRPDQAMLGRREWIGIAMVGLLEATLALGAFAVLVPRGIDLARTAAFSIVVYSQLFRAAAARSRTRVYWEVGPFSNLTLAAVIALSVALQVLIIYVPPTQALFHLAPLPLWTVAATLGIGLVPASLLEIAKLVRRRICV
jgi:P-type Ca2+ transporter type 2C